MKVRPMQNWGNDPRLARAHVHAQRAEVLQAELLYRAVLKDHPDCTPAARAVAALAADRDDLETALQILQAAAQTAPADASVLYDLAQMQWRVGAAEAALAQAEAVVSVAPGHFLGWMLLGDLREAAGDAHGALRAWYQAVNRAQAAGHWLNRESTDPAILEVVMRHIERLNQGQREYLFRSFEEVRARYGGAAMVRVDKALRGYLGEIDTTPSDPRQRPKFFHFPDLPPGPYHDPYLHAWAPVLGEAWADIRAEAAGLLAQDRDFESFLGLKPGQDKRGYVGGSNPDASWDAFFFYRHGKRFDANHALCPKTSTALDSIELCRVNNQAPEVCFSVIRPQSTIEPHHGVTNTRLVMHVPLIVPAGCALTIVDGPSHHWKEGELMMFDDTFQHGAINPTDEPRLIVLMDCWNPHLSGPEREAVQLLMNAMDAFEN